ncbi:MAG TPA: guanosine monophosphate reductase [Candidatus Woesebacteria bacterium]|nr:guanosine monophosphate reductase [Candidatus Woesebacteria bacterium]
MSEISYGLTFNDVLLIPQYSQIPSRSQVSLKTNLTPKVTINLPLAAANMDTVVGQDLAVAIAKVGGVAFYPRFATPDIQVKEVKAIFDQGLFTVPSVGIKYGELERFDLLVRSGATVILVDVAHAHQKNCLDFIKFVKKKYPKVEVIAGAAATYQATKDLFKAGADAVKVGVGPGSACTTRIMTGSGMPQLTAIMEAAKASKEFSRPILADGGLKNSGDVVKALAAGASCAMSGNLFAGCLETPGEIIVKDNQKYKNYNGSASATEKQHQFAQNPQEKTADYVKYVEGLERLVPLRGSIVEIVEQLEKGIRSGFTYSGALNIDELHRRAQFIQVTSSVIYENQHRDLTRL